MRGRLLRWYGSDPLHLIALLLSFAIAGYAARRMLGSDATAVIIWFAGAVIGHDLVLLPLYTLADRPLTGLARRRVPATNARYVNYVRVPAALSALLLLIWFPLILRLPDAYKPITGRSTEPYLGRWLLVSGGLFALSAVALALRLRRDRAEPDRGGATLS